MKETLKIVMESKFKQAGRDLFSEIDSIFDIDLLKRIGAALGTTDSLEKVREVWTKTD